MTQQVPPALTSPRRLRKDFLIVGIVLLILSFFCFYWASRVNWDYVTTYDRDVDIGYPNIVSNYGFGDSYFYLADFPTIEMQPNDFLTIHYSQQVQETVYITLFDETNLLNTTVLRYQTFFLSYTNLGSLKLVKVFLAIPPNQNLTSTTIPLTLIVHHYETPQWVYFGFGVVLSSLAMIPIFKSKKSV